MALDVSSTHTGTVVSTPVYEGPFDMLLQLILREQVDIYEINLSSIVDAYLVEIERMQMLDLDVATGFLLIAATLVELKARRLLPNPTDIDLDDEFALWEERDMLLARLLEAKTFKDVAQIFSKLADEADLSFPRVVGPDERFAAVVPDMLEGTSVTSLRSGRSRPSRFRWSTCSTSIRSPSRWRMRWQNCSTNSRVLERSRSDASPPISSTASR